MTPPDKLKNVGILVLFLSKDLRVSADIILFTFSH